MLEPAQMASASGAFCAVLKWQQGGHWMADSRWWLLDVIASNKETSEIPRKRFATVLVRQVGYVFLSASFWCGKFCLRKVFPLPTVKNERKNKKMKAFLLWCGASSWTILSFLHSLSRSPWTFAFWIRAEFAYWLVFGWSTALTSILLQVLRRLT